MIILEGADNTGKSTLAKHLRVTFGLDIVHAGGPGYSPVRLNNELASLRRKCIMDRSNFISGPVYAKAFNRDEKQLQLFNEQKQFIDSMLANDLVIVIHCVGYGEPTKRDDESVEYARKVVAHDEEIRCAYLDYFDPTIKWRANYVQYDFSVKGSTNSVTNYVAAFLRRWRDHSEDYIKMVKSV